MKEGKVKARKLSQQGSMRISSKAKKKKERRKIRGKEF